LPFSVSYTQSGVGRYEGSIGTVWGRYGKRLELRYGMVGFGMGAVLQLRYGMVGFGIWERYGSSIGAAVWDRYGMIGFGIRERYGSSMASGVKRYIRKVPDDALSDIFIKI